MKWLLNGVCDLGQCCWRGSPWGASSGGASVGMRKLSLAHAPRSICLQRSLQKGRYTFAGLYTLLPPQLGQVTMRACGEGAGEWGILGVILLLKSAGLIFCGPRRYAVSGLGLAEAYAHRVSSNAASSLQACKRPSASNRISRTETIKRLPLISGIRFSAGSMRSRSSWKVRPWGRFC